MKKMVSIFLTLSLMLTIAFASPLHILAAEKDNVVLVMKGEVNNDTGEIEIDVIVEENAGVCGMLLLLVYDTSVLTLIDLEYGTALASLSPIHTNTETDAGYGIYPFKITYLGEENDTSTGTMMTLRFRANDHAPDGNYTITFQYERDQDVTYLKDEEIMTKNLLIDSAKITLLQNQIANIDIVTGSNEQNPFVNHWIPIVIGGLLLAGICFLLVSRRNKRNQSKKWKRL